MKKKQYIRPSIVVYKINKARLLQASVTMRVSNTMVTEDDEVY
jgi:hypothetical protein